MSKTITITLDDETVDALAYAMFYIVEARDRSLSFDNSPDEESYEEEKRVVQGLDTIHRAIREAQND